MIRYRVRLLQRAVQDLEDIYDYIARSLLVPSTAERIVDEIEEAILSLEYFPLRCAERRVGFYADKTYRQLLVGNYMIVFRIDESSKTVIITTVKYSHRQF